MSTITKQLISALLAVASALTAFPATDSISTGRVDYVPKLSGVLRGRWELEQTDAGGVSDTQSRFAMRNARMYVTGNVAQWAGYFVSADFCTYGKFHMFDAYAWLDPVDGLRITMGQSRIPLAAETTIRIQDYVFADRSYIGRYSGNLRAVGVKAAWTIPRTPLILDAGVFGGYNIADHAKGWGARYQYAARLCYKAPVDVSVWAGFASLAPEGERLNQIDVAARTTQGRFTISAEYQRRFYTDSRLEATDTYVAWIEYLQPLRCRLADRLSLHGRFDATDDYYSGKPGEGGLLDRTLTERRRITAGVSAGRAMGRWVRCMLRLDYEHTFMHVADTNRLVAEFVLAF